MQAGGSALSPFVLRLIVGFVGAAAVGASLITLLVVRRRKRARGQEAVPQPPAPGERPRQPGLLQTLIVSVAASVISGVLLFFITPLFAPESPDTIQRSDISQAISADSAVTEAESPLDSDIIAEESELVAAEQSEASSSPEPGEPETTVPGGDREVAPAVDVTAPDIDVLLADTTAEWDALLRPPAAFNEFVPGDGRLQIAGASTSKITQLTALDPRLSPEISEPRILLGQVGVTQIQYPITPTSEKMAMDPRPIIEGARAVSLLWPSAPPSPGPQVLAGRVLVENAGTTLLLGMDVPDLSAGSN